MDVKYVVTLAASEYALLHSLLRGGKAAAATLAHAHMLLKADQGPGG